MKAKLICLLATSLLFGRPVSAQSTLSGGVKTFGSSALTTLSAGAGPTSYTYYTPMGTGWHDLGSATAAQPNGEPAGTGDLCPSNTFGGFGSNFDDNCHNLFAAWSSAIVDQANRRMILWGGGHTDYSGNEIYGLQFGPSIAMTRYNGPSQPGNNVEVLSTPFGPNSRHTYNGIVYMANTQQMFVVGGALASSTTPDVSSGEWLLDLSSVQASCAAGTNQTSSGCAASWTNISSSVNGTPISGWGGSTDQPMADYWDATLGPNGDNCVYMAFVNETGAFGKYCPLNNKNTLIKNLSADGGFSPPNVTPLIEQKTGIMIFVGAGSLQAVDLATGNQANHASDSGCSTPIAAGYPGVAYDEVAAAAGNDDVIIYPGSGQSVYILHTGGTYNGTWSCTAETLGSNTPASANSTGVFGHFRYMRLEDAFIYCPGTDVAPANAHCWSYRRRTNGIPTSSERQFAYRAASPGVTRATNFATTDFVNNSGNSSTPWTVEPDSQGSFANYSRDSVNVPAENSGIGGAFHVTSPATGVGDHDPEYHVCMDIYEENIGGGGTTTCQATYGPTGNKGNTIYLQFRWRADSNALTVEPGLEAPSPQGGEGWKIAGIHGTSPDSTCNATGQVLVNNLWHSDSAGNQFLTGFQNCGSGSNQAYATDPSKTPPYNLNTGYLAESTGYGPCSYNTYVNCSDFAHANTWYTFYCKWFVPQFDEATVYPNGHGSIECWWQPGEGVAMQKIWSFIGWSYNFQTNSSDNYSRVYLFDFDTNRQAAGNFAVQNFWWSELIVSSKPICAPFGTYNGNCYPGN